MLLITFYLTVLGDGEDSQPQKTKCCTLCKKPMKGHKEVIPTECKGSIRGKPGKVKGKISRINKFPKIFVHSFPLAKAAQTTLLDIFRVNLSILGLVSSWNQHYSFTLNLPILSY